MALVFHPNLVVFVVERQSLRLVGDVLTQQHLDDMAGSCDPLVAADHTAEQQLKVRIETRDQSPLPDEGKQRLAAQLEGRHGAMEGYCPRQCTVYRIPSAGFESRHAAKKGWRQYQYTVYGNPFPDTENRYPTGKGR